MVLTDLELLRVKAVRKFCEDQISHDVHTDGTLTDRAWAAETILNILNGKVDDQLIKERGAR